MKVLVTCPPMIGILNELDGTFEQAGWEVTAPKMAQTLTEAELIDLVPRFDGWIAGDDPVSRPVLQAGLAGRFKAVVKWGVGTDNVDFQAAKDLGVPVANTPAVFGDEVADVAVGYLIGLARGLFSIDRGVRTNSWPKHQGTSLRNKKVALCGFGNIGREVAIRLTVLGMRVHVSDPYFANPKGIPVVEDEWPAVLQQADFLVLTCPLTKDTKHMLNKAVIGQLDKPLRVINVARGPLIDESALVAGLSEGKIAGAALDVYETEPLPSESPLRHFDQCIFGSHNASNTKEAALRASLRAIELLGEKMRLAEV